MFPENWHSNLRFVVKTTKTPVFVLIIEILWQTFWHNKWRFVCDVVKNSSYKVFHPILFWQIMIEGQLKKPLNVLKTEAPLLFLPLLYANIAKFKSNFFQIHSSETNALFFLPKWENIFSVYFLLFPYPKNFSQFFSSHWKK